MSCVYALKCADGAFYVGRTIDIVSRFGAHKSGHAAEWTKAHPAEAILELVPDGPYVELVLTLQYMQRYGIEKVRGGPWCQLTLSQGGIDTITALMRSEGFARPESKDAKEDATLVARDSSSRVGQRWNDEEDARLITELRQSVPLETIAKSHGRTEGAIKTRVRHTVGEFVAKGFSLEQISVAINLTLRDVQQCVHGRLGPDMTSYLST